MPKIAIVIDDWKLQIFIQHLFEAGYKAEQSLGVTANTLTLTVIADSLEELGTVVRAASIEARKRKMH